MIRFKCDSCGKKIKVGTEHAGRRAKCPQCGHVLTIPAASPPEDEDYELDASSSGMDAPRDPQEAAAPTEAPGPEAPAGGGGQCPKCGSQVGTEAVICISCGHNHQWVSLASKRLRGDVAVAIDHHGHHAVSRSRVSADATR
ncbi:MAG: hypothetical protein CMJ18_06775 [Phycisphaeraceae bacterium]|nr:hypothetical protein [Phycisphaeraceae bacterium]